MQYYSITVIGRIQYLRLVMNYNILWKLLYAEICKVCIFLLVYVYCLV